MKRIIFLLLTFLFFQKTAECQVIYSPIIDSVINLVSADNISKMNRELTGDTLTTVWGSPYLIYSRAWNSPGNVIAAQYIYEKFLSYGLSPKYMLNSLTNVNVYAVKPGTKYPNQKIIIGAHYDNLLYSNYPGPLDTIHGADDNASGVCGVLEAARLLANVLLDYTVVFVAFDQEEAPSILMGSKAFADSCYFRGDSLIGMINLDMIGWDGNNDGRFAILTDTNSYLMDAVLYNCLITYPIGLHFFKIYTEPWDQSSFWNRGYKAIGFAEEARMYFNPYYHTIEDTFDKFNVPYFQKMVKAAISMLMTYAMNLHFDFYHKVLTSTTDTSMRNADVFISFPMKIAEGENAPKLYYKNLNGAYISVNAVSSANGNYNYVIPGFPDGSKIFYYFAAQDSGGTVVQTFPNGGSGLNPPGTVPPPIVFSYDIYNSLNQCSNSLPKPINDLQFTYDTIRVAEESKLINNIRVNLTIYHPDDGDLIIQLRGPNGMINLSQGNGIGGANFVNTTFDDSASISIAQGTPPYTGNFRPNAPLSFFENQPASAMWNLRIFDSKSGNTGTLESWCVLMQLKSAVNIKEPIVPVNYELYQNYPNPFNPVTNIKYRIAKNGFVKLKIYDVLGKEIETLVSENQNAGEYIAVFNASVLSSGVYFYRLETKEFSCIKKMVLVK